MDKGCPVCGQYQRTEERQLTSKNIDQQHVKQIGIIHVMCLSLTNKTQKHE
jgi:hypothetical protein